MGKLYYLIYVIFSVGVNDHYWPALSEMGDLKMKVHVQLVEVLVNDIWRLDTRFMAY